VKQAFPSARVWLGIAAVATSAVFLLSYRSVRQNDISGAAVQHTQQTLSALVALEGAISDVIFASGDEAIARASDAAVNRVDDLSVLTRDNARQQQRLTRLRGEIESVVTTRRRSPGSAVEGRAEASVPQSLSRTVRELRTEELQLLTSRVEASRESFQRVTSTLIAVAVSSGLLLVWVFGLVIRDERKWRDVEAVLRRANEDLDARVSARTAELHDALDREQALRREAEASSRLKDEFLMTVSHELRTPLNSLLGWADMLRLGIVSDERRQRAVEAIYDNAKLQTILIDDLLDTARILTGKLRIEPTLVDLGEIIRAAVNVVAPAAAAKGLELTVETDGHGARFLGDPGRLQQIVWNLVSNAVKFTDQGTVSVRLARTEDDIHMRIVVADTGIGINEDFLPQVFDRFSQEKTGTTRPHGGLGLGLAIVRQLVELHGGTIRVQSDGEGHGTAFTVILPAMPARTDAAATRQVAATTAMFTEAGGMPVLDGIRVLIVDDDAGAREMVTAVLEYCGANVASAASAAQARTALGQNACDVLLVDIAMPDEDGYTFIRRLRREGMRQPVAALTALAHETDRVRALESGFDVHIQKPVEPRTLAKAVASLVSARAHPELMKPSAKLRVG
jgi:signal transduction histidine kinase/ActR/RegA family two-component response regulator